MTRRRDTRAPAISPSPPGRRRGLAVLAVTGLAAALAIALWRSGPEPAPPRVPGGAAERGAASPSSPSSAAEGTPRQYLPLLGEWLRPDGGYVLSVQRIASDGSATVQYFNPRPIRVARAEARQEGDLVGLFVEFDDVGYPGSTYTLGYDRATDQLRGIYYQAVQRAQFQVAFARRR
jgi:hypothetical protein